jgi:hypothetical protein
MTTRTPRPPRKLRARTPDDVLALVPRLFGFHPQRSLCLLGFGAATFHARVDLPTSVDDVPAMVDCLDEALDRQRVDRAVVVVYTTDADLASPCVQALCAKLAGRGVEVTANLRADGQRWFCLRPDGEPCVRGCDPLGTPYDLGSHRLTAEGVYDGAVVYANREELRASLRGADASDRGQVEEAVSRLMARPHEGALWLEGETRWLDKNLQGFLDRPELGSETVARLAVSLQASAVRDVAWAAMDRASAASHVTVWRQVLLRVPDPLAAPPAALLAFAAWLAGDGALAWCALDRCEEAEPGYRMAALLTHALAAALPPSSWRPLR